MFISSYRQRITYTCDSKDKTIYPQLQLGKFLPQWVIHFRFGPYTKQSVGVIEA